MLTLQSTLIPNKVNTDSDHRFYHKMTRSVREGEERCHLVIYLVTHSPPSPHCLEMRALSDCDSLTHILPVLSSRIRTSWSIRTIVLSHYVLYMFTCTVQNSLLRKYYLESYWESLDFTVILNPDLEDLTSPVVTVPSVHIFKYITLSLSSLLALQSYVISGYLLWFNFCLILRKIN